MSYSLSGDAAEKRFTQTSRQDEHFPSPFLDAASLAMPSNMMDILEMCQRVWYSSGTYRSAMERVVAYFMTDVNVGGMGGVNDELGEDEKSKWEDFLRKTLDILSIMSEASRNRLAYGNTFLSPIVPFARYVVCRNKDCRFSTSHEEFTSNSRFQFKWRNFEYHGKCVSCNRSGAWTISDRVGSIEHKLKFKIWVPQEIKIVHCEYSMENAYYWRLPSNYVNSLKTGRNLETIRNAPRAVLDCARTGRDFKFSPKSLYHMKEPTLAGVKNGGWGIPRTLWHFRDIWYLQVLRRYNEAIAMDYVIPFRVMSPPKNVSQIGGDPLMGANLGDFAGHARQMIRDRRRDPASMHVFPYPVEYQVLGGEASQLAPHELITQGEDALLNSAQVFAEFYRGSFSHQGAPGALRLFEAIWYPLRHEMDAMLRWITEQISDLLSWESVDCRLTRPQHADDLQRHMTLVQLMMSGAISRTTGLKALQVDFEDETRTKAEEGAFEAQQMKRVEEEAQKSELSTAFTQQVSSNPLMQQAMGAGDPAAQGGAAPGPAPGGDPAAGGMPQPPGASLEGLIPSDGTPMSPEDMQANGEAIAQQILALPSNAERRRILADLKQKNEFLYSYVKQQMTTMRDTVRSQAGDAAMSQQFGQP